MNESELRTPFHYDTYTNTTNPSLPDSYTEILPTKGGKPEPDQYPDQHLPNVNLISENAKDWLACLENEPERNEQSNCVSFSAFFSSTAEQHTFKTISTLLPLLEESINSPAMVRHCMYIIEALVRHLNPYQMIMITAD